VIVFGEAHLRRVLKAYASYCNQVRTHLSLHKDAPDCRRAQPVGNIAASPVPGAYTITTSGFEFSVSNRLSRLIDRTRSRISLSIPGRPPRRRGTSNTVTLEAAPVPADHRFRLDYDDLRRRTGSAIQTISDPCHVILRVREPSGSKSPHSERCVASEAAGRRRRASAAGVAAMMT